jgi:hypothetical protein
MSIVVREIDVEILRTARTQCLADAALYINKHNSVDLLYSLLGEKDTAVQILL